MSGDCPHREQLNETLQQYEQQKKLLTKAHTDYLHIIGELKEELDLLSCQVISISKKAITSTDLQAENIPNTSNFTIDTQQTQEDYDITFLSTLHAVERQNDLLQTALEQATQNRADYCLELEAKVNAYLKAQLQNFLLASTQKDKLIAQQDQALKRLASPAVTVDQEALNSARTQLQDAQKRIDNLESDLDRSRSAEQKVLSELRNLNDNLIESKRKNGELQTQLERLRLLLKDKNENYEDLVNKFEGLSKRFEIQTKQIRDLQQSIMNLQKSKAHDAMENKLLQHQLTKLKQKDATTTGHLKALEERYKRLEIEHADACETINKTNSVVRHKDQLYASGIKRQQETYVELEKQLKKTLSQLEKCQAEYKELYAVCLQQTKTIESYKKWKVQQLKADASTKEAIAEYEDHLRLLTEQNMSCLERCRSLNENNQCLREEIERLRVQSLSIRPGNFTPISTRSPTNLLSTRLEQLRLTTQRVLRQKIDLKNDIIQTLNNVDLEMVLPIPSAVNAVQSNLSPRSSLTATEHTAEKSNRPSSTNELMKPP